MNFTEKVIMNVVTEERTLSQIPTGKDQKQMTMQNEKMALLKRKQKSYQIH
jgi:hypothetical protein